jgi:hypothetical protein
MPYVYIAASKLREEIGLYFLPRLVRVDREHPNFMTLDHCFEWRCRPPLVKAIVRAFRWREMLEISKYATIAEIAKAEKINESYVGRVLRLTLLAPDIVEAILGGSIRRR